MKPIDHAFIQSRLRLLMQDFDKRTDTQIAKELAYLALTADGEASKAYLAEQITYESFQELDDASDKSA